MKPKNRVFCHECGREKMFFESELKALNFIKFNSDNFDEKKPNKVYYCQACLGWHISSKGGDRYANPITDNIVQLFSSVKKITGFYNTETRCYIQSIQSSYSILKSLERRGKLDSEKVKKHMSKIEMSFSKIKNNLTKNDISTINDIVENAKELVKNVR